MSQSVMTASVRPILPTSAGERIADRPVSLAEQPPSARGDQASAAARDLSVPVIKTGKRPRLKLWAPVLACGFIAAAAYVYVPHLYVAETDDAFVQADTVAVVPKVAAYVSALRVTDNSTFSAGQLLVELDPRDFEVALDSATADLHSAEAARRSAEDQLREQGATTAAAQAQIDGDRATLGFATQQLARYGDLARTGFGTTQRFQQAQSDSGERTAALRHDLNALEAAKAHEVLLQTQINQADAAIAHAQAAVAQARLNLSYTKIYAPSAGSVANRSVQVGNFVQPGQTLLSAVPDEVYVVANFKETQLARMREGQPVTVRIDAFPGLRLRAHVDSFQRGTGSTFALLPPENATGNFVKIVQRVPVKIMFDEPAEIMRRVAPGMSVEPTVTIAKMPRCLTWLLG